MLRSMKKNGAFAVIVISMCVVSPVCAQTPRPNTQATAQPEITLGVPIPEQTHKSRMAVGPSAYGVRLSLTPAEPASTRREPTSVSLWLSNDSGQTVWRCVGPLSKDLQFTVRDEKGNVLSARTVTAIKESTNPWRCVLRPNVQWYYNVPVSDFVLVPGSGSYVVSATLRVSVPASGRGPGQFVYLHSNAITLQITR